MAEIKKEENAKNVKNFTPREANAIIKIKRGYVEGILTQEDLIAKLTKKTPEGEKYEPLKGSNGEEIVSQIKLLPLKLQLNGKVFVERANMARYINLTKENLELLKGIKIGKIYDFISTDNLHEAPTSSTKTVGSSVRGGYPLLKSFKLSKNLEDFDLGLTDKEIASDEIFTHVQQKWDAQLEEHAKNGKTVDLKFNFNSIEIVEWKGFNPNNKMIIYVGKTGRPRSVRKVTEGDDKKRYADGFEDKDYKTVLIFKHDENFKTHKDYNTRGYGKDGLETYVMVGTNSEKRLQGLNGLVVDGIELTLQPFTYNKPYKTSDGKRKVAINYDYNLSIYPIVPKYELDMNDFEDFEESGEIENGEFE